MVVFMRKEHSRKLPPHDEEDDLSPEFLLELRRRIADSKDPVRYAVFSKLADRPRWRLWLDVSDDVYGMSIDQATLFKRVHVAQAVARSRSTGKRDHLSVAKITTKNGKRRILKIGK